jgi:5-methyltetrahydropteroyltriglutamate--homocysteine methyltransferase
LAEILDLLLDIPCQGLSVVAANGQHRATTYQAIQHLVESRGWPTGKILIPGVVDTLTAVEEHPETIATLVELYATLIGRENVLAGTDCGFATIVGVFETVVPTAVWSRLQVLKEGARIASGRLWQEQAGVV